MSSLCKYEHAFEDKQQLTTIIYKGRPCWIAREVGRVLGYANESKQFVRQIMSDWGEEFLPGEDYEILSGGNLSTFKKLLGLGVKSTPSRARHWVRLYESLVWLE